MNVPVYKLPKNNNLDIFTKSKHLVITTPFENRPLFSLGYHHFIDRTRSALSITNKLESKNEFYYVVNPYEPNIPNYEDNIKNLSKIYLNLSKDKPDIFSRDFYKIWETAFLFDILDKTNLNTLVLNDLESEVEADYENNIAILQGVVYYRDKFLPTLTKKDQHYVLTNDKNTVIKSIDKNIKSINKLDKDSYDLIITNCSSKNENEFIDIFINQLIMICEHQNSGGNLILKVFDTFTMATIKLLYLLATLYEEMYIFKPYFSRPSESEKYIILKNFTASSSDIKKLIPKLEEIQKATKTKNFITDVFIDLEIKPDFINYIKFSNIKLVNQQQILINEIVKFIKENNYFGDKYHDFRNQQIEATGLWISNFFPPSNNLYKTNKENLVKLTKTTIDKTILEKDKFINNLI
uniref:Ribosomal RNA methyltransferase FtsJ domain-containing protein n=1 Tax=viral metagenome TaxID=1070528 RepID=A0A6C0DBJ2_9ZZZZ